MKLSLLTRAGGILVLAVAAIAGLSLAGSASAQQQGAATNLGFVSKTCHADGTVTGTLSWNPSGIGPQFVELALDAGFANKSQGGPYGANASSVDFTRLQEDRTYYARVLTVAGGSTLVSSTIAVEGNCPIGGGGGSGGAVTQPTNLDTQVLSGGRVLFDWTPGANNQRFCLDTARTASDLFNLTGTWRNHGCGTTASQFTVSNLSCGTTYVWLVYAWGPQGSIKSDPAVVGTGSCAPQITAPTNLEARVVSNDSILFDWTPGTNNQRFCLDLARSQSDLLNLTGSWHNRGCGMTSSQIQVSNLACDTTYYWLIYAYSGSESIKSNVATVHTPDCKSGVELAPIVDVDVVENNGRYIAQITAALPDGCHEPDSHRVRRSGDTIEITVWNDVAPGPCTLVYSEYDLNVNLGSDFDEGEIYTVIVNDEESDTFFVD